MGANLSFNDLLTYVDVPNRLCGYSRAEATLIGSLYRHSAALRYYLDLRAFTQGRKFFKTKAESEGERLRQLTTQSGTVAR